LLGSAPSFDFYLELFALDGDVPDTVFLLEFDLELFTIDFHLPLWHEITSGCSYACVRGTGFCDQSANVDGRATKPLLLLCSWPESRLALLILQAELQELPQRGVCPSFEPSNPTS
jgi:hypothetical protein